VPAPEPPSPVLLEPVVVTLQAPRASIVNAPRTTDKDFMFIFSNPLRKRPEFDKDGDTVTEA